MKLIPFLILFTFLYSCHKSNIATTGITSNIEAKGEKDTLAHQTKVAALDLQIRETSGLAMINNAYWTVNDSGDEPRLYQFDIEAGKVLNTVGLQDAKNQDWESLAEDDTHMYIGDFGNNTGGRKNLRIFKIEITQLSNSVIEKSETITFKYQDQEKYYSGYDHNFDCEAMVSKGDSLFLFSKNWLDRKCKLYGLSKNVNDQSASLISEFDSGGTITGASIHKSKKEIYLLGYNGIGVYSSFVWILSDWEGSDFFSGKKTKYDLTINRQTEGIVVDKDGNLLISAEQNRGGHPSLYLVELE